MIDNGNDVAFGAYGDFVVADEQLTHAVSGGFTFQFGVGSENTVNNGCVEDKNNNGCVNPNTFCAADTACGEFL